MSASTGTSPRTCPPPRATRPGLTGTWMSRWGNLAYDLITPDAAVGPLPAPTTTLPAAHYDSAGFAA